MKVIVKSEDGGSHVWNVVPKCRQIAGRIAKKLGLTIEEFLTRLTLDKLPGGPRRESKNDLEDPTEVPTGFRVTPCADKRLWERVVRVAENDNQSVEFFVWRSIASNVVCTEADLITDPQDGRVLGMERDLDQFREVYGPDSGGGLQQLR